MLLNDQVRKSDRDEQHLLLTQQSFRSLFQLLHSSNILGFIRTKYVHALKENTVQ
jgi:hypothetical protein